MLTRYLLLNGCDSRCGWTVHAEALMPEAMGWRYDSLRRAAPNLSCALVDVQEPEHAMRLEAIYLSGGRLVEPTDHEALRYALAAYLSTRNPTIQGTTEDALNSLLQGKIAIS